MTSTKNNIFKALAFLLVVGIVGTGYFFIATKEKDIAIVEFDEQRDMQPLIKSFNDDWYWLIDAEPHEYSIYDAIHTKTPDPWDKQYEGKLQVKVLRDHGQFAGFVAFYHKNFYEGKVLYLNIAKEFRHKKYGEKLLRHAIAELFKQGSEVATLVTRPTNIPALSLYKKSGMKEASRNDRYVYLKINKQEFAAQK